MLTIVYAFNFIDRQILVILQEPIKNDMNLSMHSWVCSAASPSR
jgi:hypothetical protein